MRYIIHSGIPIIISIALSVLFVFIQKSNTRESVANISHNHIIVTLPKIYFWIGCIDILFFGICFFLSIYKPNGTATIWVWVMFGFFVLLGIVIIWATLMWKIDVFRNEEFFIYRTFWGHILKIRYDECKQYEIKENTMVLKTARKNLYIDMFSKNYDVFLSMLHQNNIKDNQGIKRSG